MSVRFKKVRKRRFDGLHNAVDTDTLLFNATRVRVRRSGDAKCVVALVRRVPKSNLETVYGDKAYISRSYFSALVQESPSAIYCLETG